MEKSMLMQFTFSLIFLLILPSMLEAEIAHGRRPKRSPLMSFASRRLARSVPENPSHKSSAKLNESYNWEEEWYEGMPIDHFAYGDARKFKLRYLINTENFVQKDAPIFIYTGNEANIETYVNHTGLIYDLGREFGAAIIFAEHRFYGKSLPFGKESFKNVSNLGYLSSEQALADYAILIGHLKGHRLPNATRSPVIAFGGSYGGLLTAWLRIKYPHVVDGGIASSAPVFLFPNGPRPGVEHSFDAIVTRSFANNGCPLETLRASFDAILQLSNTSDGQAFLNQQFHLFPESDNQVKGIEDGNWLISWTEDAMGELAIVDYPYPANFSVPLPGWPVKEACKPFASAHTQEELALASYNVLNIFYNYTGTLETLCLGGENCTTPGPYTDALASTAWNWQSCTEMVLPTCSRGPPFDPFNYLYDALCPYNLTTSHVDACTSLFGHIGYNSSLFRPNWIYENYGTEYPTATNLIFSNGYLDPWSGAGWRLNTTREGSLVSLIIKDGAHHYDLRGQHPNDTEAVKDVRRQEKLHIKQWIQQARERHQQQETKNSTVA